MAFEQQARHRKERRKGYLGDNFIKPHTSFRQRNGSETFPCLRKHGAASLSITSALCFVGILYGENELRAGAKCIGEIAGSLSIEKEVRSSANFLTFLEFHFYFFWLWSFWPLGPYNKQGHSTIKSTKDNQHFYYSKFCHLQRWFMIVVSHSWAAQVSSQITKLTSEMAANFKYYL